MINYLTMEPMKYYEGDRSKQKAIDMIENKGGEYSAMRKYDGEWCRAVITEDGVKLQSRSISKKTGTYGDKTELVPHIVEELKEFFSTGTVLIGELAFSDYTSTSTEVGSILRCLPPKAIERQKAKKIHFYIFDVICNNGQDVCDKPFIDRFSLIPDLSSLNFVHQAEKTEGDFMEFSEKVWSQGGEGIMIIKNSAPYQPGKRTAWNSLKIKKKLENLEGKVIGLIEPNRVYAGTELHDWKYFVDENDNPVDLTKMIDYGKLTPVTKPYYFGWKNGVIVEYEGRTISITSGLNDAVRSELNEMTELIKEGRLWANFTGMELTPDSVRHPVFLGLKELPF